MLLFGENILWPQFYIFSLIVLIFACLMMRSGNLLLLNGKQTTQGKVIPVSVIYLRLFFFILFIMSAFRGIEITNDTGSYLRTYRTIKAYGLMGEERMEQAYVWLNLILAKLFPQGDMGFYVLLFLVSAISYYAMEQWLEENSETYGESIFLFYFMMNSSFMCVVRQTLAFSIVLLGLKRAKNKELFRFLIYVVIACMFHKTAIIGILLYAFMHTKFSSKKAAIIIGIAGGIVLTQNAIARILEILGITTSYVTSGDGLNVVALVLPVFYLALIALDVIKKKSMNRDDSQKGFFKYCIIFSVATFILILRMPVFNRISSYFTYLAVPYVSNVISEIEDKKSILIIRIILFAAVWGYATITLTYRPEWQHLWPYRFFWNSMYQLVTDL